MMPSPVPQAAPLCLCSHGQGRHGRNNAGPHAGGCLVPLCGCLWYRRDPAVKGAAAREAG